MTRSQRSASPSRSRSARSSCSKARIRAARAWSMAMPMAYFFLFFTPRRLLLRPPLAAFLRFGTGRLPTFLRRIVRAMRSPAVAVEAAMNGRRELQGDQDGGQAEHQRPQVLQIVGHRVRFLQ